MPERGLLGAAAALLECVAGEADHVERVHDRDGVGELLEVVPVVVEVEVAVPRSRPAWW